MAENETKKLDKIKSIKTREWSDYGARFIDFSADVPVDWLRHWWQSNVETLPITPIHQPDQQAFLHQSQQPANKKKFYN